MIEVRVMLYDSGEINVTLVENNTIKPILFTKDIKQVFGVLGTAALRVALRGKTETPKTMQVATSHAVAPIQVPVFNSTKWTGR